MSGTAAAAAPAVAAEPPAAPKVQEKKGGKVQQQKAAPAAKSAQAAAAAGEGKKGGARNVAKPAAQAQAQPQRAVEISGGEQQRRFEGGGRAQVQAPVQPKQPLSMTFNVLLTLFVPAEEIPLVDREFNQWGLDVQIMTPVSARATAGMPHAAAAGARVHDDGSVCARARPAAQFTPDAARWLPCPRSSHLPLLPLPAGLPRPRVGARGVHGRGAPRAGGGAAHVSAR